MDGLRRDAGHLLGKLGIGVAAMPEGVKQVVLPGFVGEHPSLDLTAVAGHEDISRCRDERLADGLQLGISLAKVLEVQRVRFPFPRSRPVTPRMSLVALKHDRNAAPTLRDVQKPHYTASTNR